MGYFVACLVQYRIAVALSEARCPNNHSSPNSHMSGYQDVDWMTSFMQFEHVNERSGKALSWSGTYF